MANNEGIKNVFSGDKNSLIQSGPGFPYLSPTIYWYLATGDLQTAIQKVTCSDVDDIELAEYIKRVSLLFVVHSDTFIKWTPAGPLLESA